MGKHGPTATVWRQRLKDYAAGTYQFGRGEKPRKNSQWDQALRKLEACPKQRNRSASYDVLGRPIVCSCGFHQLPSRDDGKVQDDPSGGAAVSEVEMAHLGDGDPGDGQKQVHLGDGGMENDPGDGQEKLGQEQDRYQASEGLLLLSQPTQEMESMDPDPEDGQELAHLGEGDAPSRSDGGTADSARLEDGGVKSEHGNGQELAQLGAGDGSSGVSSWQVKVPLQAAPPGSRLTISSTKRFKHTVLGGTVNRGASSGQSTVSHQSIEASSSSRDQQTTRPKSTRPAVTGAGSHLTAEASSQPRPAFGPEPPPTGKKRQPTDYSNRLPEQWTKTNMKNPADQEWVGKTVFVKKGELTANLQHWYHPPQLKADGQTTPVPEQYFMRRLFVWMPRRMYNFDFQCPTCRKKSLTSKGIYQKVRLVMDIRDYYYLCTEYLTCYGCSGTFQAWDSRVLQQLPDHLRMKFPALLTHKYACDKAVVALMKARTLGNSSSAMRNNIRELHSEEWLRRQISYLSACKTHKAIRTALRLQPCEYEEAPSFPSFPQAKWFLASYVRDIYSRLPTLKAEMTSTFGNILKIDSTKKVCRKLQGDSAGTAGWSTNVGNERGQVLQSVLTTTEGKDALEMLASGLMNRYKRAGKLPPVLLYTDRDCCAESGPSRFQALFAEWKDLEVRMDIWHYMRRLAVGCSSESHPLYATFMSKLSDCIFEWSADDYTKLLHAKKAELVSSGVENPSEDAVRKALTREEVARHCRRQTRGEKSTVELIEQLILSLSTATDSLGVPLFRQEIKDIWQQQRKHVRCIQDPAFVQLYTLTGHIKKGGVTVPVYRSARGTTSLESFHLHLNRFIPGTSANAVNFQAYLVEGVTRWNKARADAAIDGEEESSRTFDTQLQQKANDLSEEIHQKPLLTKTTPPFSYTGELIGVEYLFGQNAAAFSVKDEDLDAEIDQGFVEEDLSLEPLSDDHPDYTAIMALPGEESGDSSDDEQTTTVDNECLDSMGIPGWDKVDRLALALLQLKGLALSSEQATTLKQLFADLPPYDRKPFTFHPTKVPKPAKGAFGRTKRYRHGHISVEKMKKAFLSGGVPASHPSKSRLVEALCIHLCNKHPHAQKRGSGDTGTFQSRWRLVLTDYNKIRSILLNSQAMEETNTMLLHLNETTIANWYKNQTRRDEVKLLLQGQKLPTPQLTTSSPLPPALARPSVPVCPPASVQHHFDEPEDRSQMAKFKRRKPAASASSTTAAELAPTTSGEGSTPVHLPPPSMQTTPPPLPLHTASEGDDIVPILPPPPAFQTPVQTTTAGIQPPQPLPLPPFKTDEPPPLPRTTAWRKRKAEASTSGTRAERKEYTCRVCSQVMTSPGHSQYQGKRYCPYAPGQVSKEEWLAQKKAEAAAKKSATSQ